MQALSSNRARVAAPINGLAKRVQKQRVVRVRAEGNTCRTCGMDLSKAGGCDQEGRVIGGLAALPGFGWWPIKAYRPCSGLEQAGLEYTRKGQGTNEMLFGGVSLAETQQQSLDKMKNLQDKGLDVEIK